MIKYLAIEPEYIGMRGAFARGLIPSKSWYYQKRPLDFPRAFKLKDERYGQLRFSLKELRQFNEIQPRINN